MPLEKYCVIKWAEVRKILSPEQQKSLGEILEAMTLNRAERRIKSDIFFVLNMKDKFAQEAVEAYIQAAESDTMNAHNPGVVDAVLHARTIRTNAMMSIETRLPT